MRRLLAFVVVACLLGPAESQQKATWPPSPHVAATDPLRPEKQREKFQLPPGFEMQLVAADPDIRKPINIAFDGAGRLWLTETIEYPFAAEGRPGRDAVKVLEDFGPDGRARKITTFADGLNIPIGILPLDTRTALVFTIPTIYRLTDTDGDGKADRREELLTGFGSKDTHGMTGEFQMGFDGWVYACHGFSNRSVVTGRDGSSITMESGNTYRFKPDGTRVEYFTHGQVNPFGLTFDPRGNLYSTDCHTRPLYQLLRGAWYPSFGKPHDGLGFGPEMVRHDHGSTAIGGIAYYADDRYPPEFRDNLFVGNVVTNRINRDRLEWRGATPQGIEMPDLVKCDDPWFRPVDIKLGPDGCLYVADFYNRIIGHYEVPLDHPGRDRDKGRIWRIVYRGGDGAGGPRPVRRLPDATVDELVQELASPNLTVRLQAGDELVRRGTSAHAALRQACASGFAPQRAHALWTLSRQGITSGLDAAASDADALVRVHVQAMLRETRGDRAHAVSGLKDSDAFVRRAAAEGLAAAPDPANLAPLLELRHRVPAQDTHLLHAVRLALRAQLRPEAAWATLSSLTWSEEDQRAIADVCLGVHHAAAAEFLKDYLHKHAENGDRLQRFCHHIVRHGKNGAAAWVLELARTRHASDVMAQGQVLKAAQQASQERGGALERSAWSDDVVARLVQSKSGSQAQLGIELAAALKVATAHDALLARALDRRQPEVVRKGAVTTLVSLAPGKALPELTSLFMSAEEGISFREQVALALAGSNHPDVGAALVKALETTPARIQAAIALGLAGSQQGAEKLVAAVESGKASPRLLQERLIEVRLQQAKVQRLGERLAHVTKNLPPIDQRLGELLSRRRDSFLAAKADAPAGRKVFEKSCAACHQIANQGSKIGPQLDGIGIRGTERLLEDLLDPNRNVDQAFRSTLLVLDSGQIINGLVLREEGEVVVLADPQGKEVRVPKKSIQQRQVSPLSPMPGNLAEQISEPDLNHLLAFLLQQRK